MYFTIEKSLQDIRNTPVISVVIPTYNRSSLISRAINSVLNQSFNDFEIIVVDDASNDDTQQILKSFDDPRIIVLKHKQNLGCSASRNTGIRFSKSQYIGFIDSDDEWLPHKLEKQLKIFQASDTDVGLVYGCWKNITRKTLKESVKQAMYRGFIFDNLLYSNVVGSPSGVIVKYECLHRIGGFDTDIPSTVEDWNTWLKLARLVKFEFVPEVLTITWDENDVVKLTKNQQKVVDGYFALLDKYPEMNQSCENLKSTQGVSLREKSNYLFHWGRRLICLGYRLSNSRAIELGQRYLRLNLIIYPYNIFSCINYLVSLAGGKMYSKFVNFENRVKNSMSQAKPFYKMVKAKS